MGATMRVVYNHFGNVRRALHDAIAQTIGEVAEVIRADMSRGAPVDTGAEAAGFYIIAEGVNGYDAAVGAAQSANESVVILPVAPAPIDRYHAHISHTPEHTIYQEFGTVFQPPQPTMIPAVERNKSTLSTRLEDALNAVIEGSR